VCVHCQCETHFRWYNDLVLVFYVIISPNQLNSIYILSTLYTLYI